MYLWLRASRRLIRYSGVLGKDITTENKPLKTSSHFRALFKCRLQSTCLLITRYTTGYKVRARENVRVIAGEQL